MISHFALECCLQIRGVHPLHLPPGRGMAMMCMWQVGTAIASHGGDAVWGWLVHDDEPLIWACRHCVWRDPAGQLRDLSQPLVAAPTAFVPDPRWRWDGRQCANLRWARRDTREARATYVELQAEEINSHNIFWPIKRIHVLSHLDAVIWRASEKATRRACKCGSGASYGSCCGRAYFDPKQMPSPKPKVWTANELRIFPEAALRALQRTGA